MSFPPFVLYKTAQEYREHYETVYCRGAVVTFDGIRVYCRKVLFDHAFFESSRRDKNKDMFSTERARRINWIRATLQNPRAELYCGWDKNKKRYDPNWRVSVVYGNYVVVIQLGWNRRGQLKGELKTAYLADNSFGKIKKSPKWHKGLMKRWGKKDGR